MRRGREGRDCGSLLVQVGGGVATICPTSVHLASVFYQLIHLALVWVPAKYVFICVCVGV